MPTLKRSTVREGPELPQAIAEARGLVDWKGDKQGHVRACVGRIGWDVEDVEKNVRGFVKAVRDGMGSTGPDNVANAKKGA